MFSFRPAHRVAGRIRSSKAFAKDFQQPSRRHAQEAAATCDGDDVLARRKVPDPDGRYRAETQLIGGVTWCQQGDAETSLDQALLRRQAVDRRPVDLAEAVRLE